LTDYSKEKLSKPLLSPFNFLLQEKNIKVLNAKSFSELMKEINIIANFKDSIFPHNISKNVTYNIQVTCKKFFNRYSEIINLISLWSNDFKLQTELICYFTYNETYNHYINIDLMLALSFKLSHFYEKSIEQSLGNIIGYYTKFTELNSNNISHMIDCLTNLFPSLYLPKINFDSEIQKVDHFNLMTSFYYSLFKHHASTIYPDVFGNIFEPLKLPVDKLNDFEIFLISDFESYFLTPLLAKLIPDKSETQNFYRKWDNLGYFQEYLLSTIISLKTSIV
jgi:hypothetical protein